MFPSRSCIVSFLWVLCLSDFFVLFFHCRIFFSDIQCSMNIYSYLREQHDNLIRGFVCVDKPGTLAVLFGSKEGLFKSHSVFPETHPPVSVWQDRTAIRLLASMEGASRKKHMRLVHSCVWKFNWSSAHSLVPQPFFLPCLIIFPRPLILSFSWE